MSTSTLQMVERLLEDLTPEEQIEVVEQVTRRLRQSIQHKPPQDLYGAWRNRFPDNFDLDAALSEIRNEWRDESNQVKNG